MARIPVGGTATVDQLGKVATPGASAVLYLTRLGGTPIADVIDEAGAAIPGGIITIPADGIFPLVRPEVGALTAVWVSVNGGPRQWLPTHNLGADEEHRNASDPHPQYLTTARGDARFVTGRTVVATGVAATDTSGLAAEIASATTLGIPVNLRGDFQVNAEIAVPAGATILADGVASIKQNAALTSIFSLNGSSDVTIEGLTLLGLTTDYVDGGGVYEAAAVKVYGGATGVRISNNRLLGFAGAGINISGSAPGIRIEGNLITGPGPTYITASSHMYSSGVRVISADNWHIVGNEISGFAQGVHTTVNVRNFSIIDNYIHDIPGQHGLYIGTASNATIAHNRIINMMLLGMKIQLKDGSGDSEDVIISDNLFKDIGDGGILLTNVGASDPGTLNRIQVVNNTIHTADADGIQANKVRSVRFAGNHITNVRAGIRVTEGADIDIVGNVIDGTSTTALVFSTDPIANVRIVDNWIKNAAGSGVVLNAGAAGFTIDGNLIDGTDLSGIYVDTAMDHASLSVTRNRLRNCSRTTTTPAIRLASGKSVLAWHGNVVDDVAGTTDPIYPVGGHGYSGVERFGTGAPTTGRWVQGDRVWNSAPAAGGSLGWVCVTTGTPGTWKSFATIAT